LTDLFKEKIEELSPPLPDESKSTGSGYRLMPLPNWEFTTKYKLGEVLGTGSFGRVYKAVKRDDPNGEIFAANYFRRGRNKDATAEIEIGLRLDHPYVHRVYEAFVGDASSSTVMVMRLMKGQDLRDRAKAIKKDLNGKMFPKEILFDWLTQCSGLMAYMNS
jgi:serine/threonine protein kinase